VDESLVDSDGDGWADAADCAPEDPAVHPYGPESPGDGLDTNCDGIDNGKQRVTSFTGCQRAMLAVSKSVDSSKLDGDCDFIDGWCLWTIAETLTISGQDVHSLRGLESLTHLGGLTIYNTHTLESLDGRDDRELVTPHPGSRLVGAVPLGASL